MDIISAFVKSLPLTIDWKFNFNPGERKHFCGFKAWQEYEQAISYESVAWITLVVFIKIIISFVPPDVLQVIVDLVDLIYLITEAGVNVEDLSDKIYKFKKLAVEILPESDNVKWNFPNWDACQYLQMYN